MIIKIIKENKKSYRYLFTCDNCGKEFKRKYCKEEYNFENKKWELGKNHFCCVSCFKKWQRGKNCHQWKGRFKNNAGYILIQKSGHPHSQRDGYVLEHRLVMEEKLGRYLTKNEVVHHINGIKDNNRLENLKLYKNINLHFIETILLKDKTICPHCNKKIELEDIV